LSGGKTLGEVLSGEMDPGDAPSPGQIALTSIGIEAARIRSGNARASDILLANPATAPFILAALKAETSPVQRADFDLMDPEQRKAAFGSGWEQWMSGITDAGLQFADPLIVGTFGIKVARSGLIGAARGSLKDRQALDSLVDGAIANIDARTGQNSAARVAEINEQAATRAEQRRLGTLDDTSVEDNIVQPLETKLLPRIGPANSRDYGDDFIADFLDRVSRVDKNGAKEMNAEAILRELPVWGSTRSTDVADMLYRSQSYFEAGQIVKALNGNADALKNLMDLRPALADEAFRLRRQMKAMEIFTEPLKAAHVRVALDNQRTKILSDLSDVEDELASLGAVEDGRVSISVNRPIEDVDRITELGKRSDELTRSVDEVDELMRLVDSEVPDHLDPASTNYDSDRAKAIVDDVVKSYRNYDPDEIRWLEQGGLDNRFWFASKNNPYSRMVMDSRKRRAEARYQYAVEGSSWFPHKRYNSASETWESDGWFSKSQFGGTSRARRNLRIWRWAGTETPSGYIGLKGTATVGSEREFTAAIDIDLYKGKAVEAIVDGEIAKIGGRQRRDELFAMFAESLNDPNVDSLQVLNRIEDMIAEDIGKAYGIQDGSATGAAAMERIQRAMRKANRNRLRTLETLQDQGYFVQDGTINKAPFLESQLANGTYMLPFKELERIAKREVKGGVSNFRYKLASAGGWVGEADALFQSFWRPATLLRLSYTQRNTLEGMIRAAAHEVSLRPFTWPVTGTAFGIRNAIVKRTTARRAGKAAEAVKSTDVEGLVTARVRSETADVDRYLLETAQQIGDGDTATFRYITRNGEEVELNSDDFAAEYQRVADESEQASEALEPYLREYETSIEGTKFYKWRKEQLRSLEVQIADNRKQLDILQSEYAEAATLETAADFKKYGEAYKQLQAVDSMLVKQRTQLLYDPQQGIAFYRGQAGRARRIGSGTSIGPNGNFYGDAFTGPLAAINRQLLSADNTVKQRLQVVADAYGSLFTDVTVKRGEVDWARGTNAAKWSEAQADFIETASSSWPVQRLVLNDGDIPKVITEMRTTAEGRRWLKQISYLFGDAAEDGVYNMERGGLGRITPFADEIEVAGTDITSLDVEKVTAYLEDVAQKIDYATQRRVNIDTSERMDALYDLLRRRVNDKAGAEGVGVGVRTTEGRATVSMPEQEQITATAGEVENIVSSLPDNVTNKFTTIAGSEVIEMANTRFMSFYGRFVGRLFKALGTIPEDAIVRGPFYNERFKKTRNMLIRAWMEDNGQADKLVSTPLRKGNGVRELDGINHESFGIPASQLNRIYVQAHRRALSDTREWLYTIERRTNLGKYGEYALPFISASQNAAVVAGKLLYKEPWLAPAIATLWNTPNRLGFEDEDGNLVMPMPFEGVTEWLAKHPEIPVLGGAVDSNDVIRIPKNGLNVMLPDTGFGLVPRTSPAIVAGASELMKVGLFSQEAPAIITSTMGEENGAEFWQLFKDYIFGEGQGMSAQLASYDKFIPAAWQKILYSRDELSRQYGYKFQIAARTENLRYKGGLRDTKPTPDEIAKRATNMLLFDAIGNFGVPTPQAPYPVITRPLVTSPIQELQDWYKQEQARDPRNASQNMSNLFGEWALQSATTKITRNIGGANPSPETVSDIQTLDPLIRQVAQTVGDNNLDVLGILVNNRSSVVDYETSAYSWQKATKIPGTNREWREIQAPQQSIAEQQRIAGWAKYTAEMDKLDARLAAAGYKSYEVKGAAGMKAAKKLATQQLLDSPDYAGWATDFLDRGGSRTLAAVQAIEAAVQDPTFRNLMVKDGKDQTYANMVEYTRHRRTLLGMLNKSGHGIDHEDNIILKTAWANIRQKLKESDVRWADIANRYLDGDDNPLAPGNAALVEQLEIASNE
jgi:hypothetical protein